MRDHALTVTEVYAADREGKLDTLTGDRATLNAPLWSAVAAWVPTSARSEETTKRYAVSFKALERSGVLKANARVCDLASVDWRKLEKDWTASAASWNHIRRSVSHFLAQTLGDVMHPLRRAVVRAIPLRREVPRVTDLPLNTFWKIVDAAEEHVRPALVTIMALGLRVGEYLALTPDHLLPNSLAVRVPGTKTAASSSVASVDERLWPWVVAGVPSPLQYRALRLAWKRACKAAGASKDLRLHDLRHCFGQYLAEAGVSEARIQAGLRHATVGMTRRYVAQKDSGELARAMGDVLQARSVRRA